MTHTHSPEPATSTPELEPAIDPALRRRYIAHLYWDVAWYGLLAGSAMAFVSVYLTRLGANALQIGMLNAGPALVGMLFTMPMGRWLHNRSIGSAVLNAAIVYRVGYAAWVVFPFILLPAAQIQAYIWITLLMTIPGTILAIGFNALYAAAVPPEDRGRVAGIRNATLAITYVLTSLLSGYILSNLPIETGYPIVFALGLSGALGSTAHLWQLRRITGREGIDPTTIRSPLGDFANPGAMRSDMNNVRASVALRVFARSKAILRPEILTTPYGSVVGALLLFHFAQHTPIALYPFIWVNELKFTDQQISIGSVVYHLTVLVGSLQLGWITTRKGNLWMMVVGVMFLSIYPLIIANATGFSSYMLASVAGGAGWSMMGGASANYLLEIVPRNDRPAYLAWYNIALNTGVLFGSLTGPLLADAMGIRAGLMVGFVLRLSSAAAIWLAGRQVRAAMAVQSAA